MTSNSNSTGKLSRRFIVGGGLAAAAGLPLVAQAQQMANPAMERPPQLSQGMNPQPPRSMQGGTGKIKVLFISKYHAFDRENLFAAFDAFDDITWTHVEHPAATNFYDPELAAPYDVLLFYDAFAGREFRREADGVISNRDMPPTPKMKRDFAKLLRNGDKGFVFFHHAIASWAHTWPEYGEVIGAVADWGKPLKNIRGKDYAASGALGGVKQHITVVDKTHPITAGVGDFDIVDEAYLCPVFEDSVHPLLRTDFKPVDSAFPTRPLTKGHPPGSNLTGWVKTAERSPVAYIQHGHDNTAWANPAWRKLMTNAIKWAASPEAKSWAHANPKRIFV
jgi:type 1 glutamine amidotransferase